MTDLTGNIRLAGVFYLGLIVSGVFAYLVVGEALIAEGDVALTMNNILENKLLFRAAYIAELSMLMCWIGLALMIYTIFKPVDRTLARFLVSFVLVASGAMTAGMVTHAGVWLILENDAYLSVFSDEQRNAAAFFLLKLHKQSYIASQLCFGLWLIPLGLLVLKSGWYYRYWRLLMGCCLVVGGITGYIVDLIVLILFPSQHATIPTWMYVPADIGEMGLCLTFLTTGNWHRKLN